MTAARLDRLTAQGRRWAGLMSFGLAEQALLSIANFTYTALMAHHLAATRFGWLSIGWATVMLIEAGGMGLFGDGIPTTANRLPAARQRGFRGAIILLSTLYGSLALAASLLAWPLARAAGIEQAALIPATGLACFALRAQTVMRRLYYLAGLRREAALAAVVCTLVMVIVGALVVRGGGAPSAALGLLIPTAGSLAAALFLLLLQSRLPVAVPDRALLRWTMRRLWQPARWLLAAGLMSYFGSSGFVIITGMLLGVKASGALRVVMTLTVPPSQLVIVMASIMLPRIAAIPRAQLAARARMLAAGAAGLLGAATGAYAVVVTLAAPWLLPAMFTHSADQVSQLIVAIATFGFALDSVRAGCNLVILSQGDTRIMMIGQTVAIVCAWALVPLAAPFGLLFVTLAMVAAANINTLVNLVLFLRKTAPASAARRG